MFTLVLGVIFYDLFNMAGFSYIDEICAFLLFILFGINVLRSKNWAFDKIFLLILGIFLFYLVYSLPRLEKLGVRRVALVGTYLQAGSTHTKPDGTKIHTLWGELAWQLGGREAYEMVADADRSGTNPGSALRTLIQKYAPALILIDEWVAYARQLVTDKELPSGSFETQFTFAQSLTEIVRSVPGDIPYYAL